MLITPPLGPTVVKAASALEVEGCATRSSVESAPAVTPVATLTTVSQNIMIWGLILYGINY